MAIEITTTTRTGAFRTKAILTLFLDLKKYHIFHNVVLKTSSSFTQIDHVIVSQYGVFVVQTKHKTHSVYGNDREAEWTQVMFGNKSYFQNPLRQSYKHIEALSEYLSIDNGAFHPLIVFYGGCKFKAKMPKNVVNNLLYFIRYIKSKTEIILTEPQVIDAIKNLKALKKDTTFIDIKRRNIVFRTVHGNHVNGRSSSH